MANRDIVVIGGSAGSLEGLRQLVAALPPGLPAAVFVVVHVAPEGPSLLPQILQRAGPLPARHVHAPEAIRPATIYVAPPDHHLSLEDSWVSPTRGPRENGSRPSVDILFRSAAEAHGRRVVGVVLSGALDDGTSGLLAIAERGGVALVQDPREAYQPSMPQSARFTVRSARAVSTAQLGPEIVRLVHEPLADEPPPPVAALLHAENRFALRGSHMAEVEQMGAPSPFTCPECHGMLWELGDGPLVRYRCHVGHGYSSESLSGKLAESVEQAAWAAVRTLQESASLAERMHRRAVVNDHRRMAERYAARAHEAREQAEVIRAALLAHSVSGEGAVAGAGVGDDAAEEEAAE